MIFDNEIECYDKFFRVTRKFLLTNKIFQKLIGDLIIEDLPFWVEIEANID